MEKCARYIVGHMNYLGIASRALTTGGYPVVYKG